MSTLVVKNGQTIFDIALIASGDASKAFELVLTNPTIDNINSDITGLLLTYTYSEPPKKETTRVVEVKQKEIVIKSTQTLFDIAVQLYGSPEFAIELIKLNVPITNLTDENIVNLNVNYFTQITAVPLFFDKKNIIVATKYPKTKNGNFLQQENGFYILQENGYKLIIN